MNQSLNETVDADPNTLQETIENLKLSLRESSAKCEALQKDLTESRSSQKQAKKVIIGLEQKNESISMLLQSNTHTVSAHRTFVVRNNHT